MNKDVRTRPGIEGDVVYEKKRWWLFWVPNFLGLGWVPFANAESEGNHVRQKLNDLCDESVTLLHELAKSALFAKEEKESLKSRIAAKKVNKLTGVSKVESLPMHFLNRMLPLKEGVPEDFKKVIASNVIAKVFRQYGLDPEGKSNKDNKSGNRRPDVLYTTQEGAEDFDPNMAHHVTAYRSEEKKNSSGNKNQSKKQHRNDVKDLNRRREGEDKGDYNERINRIIEDE